MTADLILGPQAPIGTGWFDKTQVERGKFHGRAFPSVPPTGAALDPYTLTNYYDLGLALAIAHKRTGDAEFQSLYRKVADSWWKTPGWIDEGRIRQFDVEGTAPRNVSLGGLILRAMDGRPEMWDWINAYTRYHFNLWLMSRINDPQLYLGLRDGAFSLQYAAWLANVLPDSFPLQAGGTGNGAQLRAQYLADIEALVVTYYQRLQYPDGSWRWDDPYFTDSDGGTLKGIMQPFMIGLTLDALTDVYEVTANATVKASILAQVTKACRHLYMDGPYSKQHLTTLNVNLRGFHYTYHGGTTVNPTKYVKGDLPPDWNPQYASDVQNQRQPIGLLVAAYGWAYKMTGDAFFKSAGDDLWDSAYGDTDGIHNYMAGDAKSYNQNCRWAGSYLVWAGTAAPTPLPPTESPNGTKAVTVTDSQGAVWTLGAQKQTLKNGIHVGAGAGSIYKYVDKIVYVLGTDSNWYKWVSSTWSLIGPTEPGTTPTPIPPEPTPTPITREVAWPSSKTAQNAVADTQWAERYRFKRNLRGAWAEFERVPK